MSNKHGRLSPFGAGLRRLWAELEIEKGRMINASALAREATLAAPNSIAGPVQPTALWGLVLGRDVSAEQTARVLHFFGHTVEECERIGTTGEIP